MYTAVLPVRSNGRLKFPCAHPVQPKKKRLRAHAQRELHNGSVHDNGAQGGTRQSLLTEIRLQIVPV